MKFNQYQVVLKVVAELPIEATIITNPETAAKAAGEFLKFAYDGGMPDREVFGILYLDSKNKIIGAEIVSIGHLNAAIVHPRETFKGAILSNACSIVAFHNHPSGNPSPSPEDIQITNRLSTAGEILGIALLDHVIVCEFGHYSLKERGDF